MLHILLIILKIIGIILAVLLGLLLLLLLLVLFVPIRYKGKLCKEKELQVAAKVSWLLHMISVPVSFRDGVLSVKIKLFGITIKKLTRDEEELEEDAEELFCDAEDAAGEGEKKIEEIEEKENPLSDSSGREKEISASPEDEGEKDRIRGEETEGGNTTIDEGEFAQEEEDGDEALSESEGREQEKSGLIKKVFDKIKAFFLKIFEIWKKIINLKYTFLRFCGKIKKGIRKYRDTKEFLLDERTKGALRKAFEQGKLLIGRLLPKKIRGELRFGTEDPALTGEILGGISIFYPIFMDNVKVYPDFERSILEGELFVKGRFRLATAALVLWRLWRDKNIRFVYHKFRGGE